MLCKMGPSVPGIWATKFTINRLFNTLSNSLLVTLLIIS